MPVPARVFALACLLPAAAFAVEMSPADSSQLASLLRKSTSSGSADLQRLSCSWKTLSWGTICAYEAPGDRDSFAWHGNAVAGILKQYVAPVQRRDRVWQIEIRNLRCGDSCVFD